MKRKQILLLEPKLPEPGNKEDVTAQEIGELLVLNYFEGGNLKIRYALNVETGEHECLHSENGNWTREKLVTGMCGNCWYSNYLNDLLDPEDIALCARLLKIYNGKEATESNIAWAIERMEADYGKTKREKAERRRLERIKNLMARVPELPPDYREWLYGQISGGREYAFRIPEQDTYICTACRNPIGRPMRQDGKKAKHNETVPCPVCGKILIVRTRGKRVEQKGHGMILQNCDAHLMAARHFDMQITWDGEGRKTILSESLRIMENRSDPELKWARNIYYNQFCSTDDRDRYESFDDYHNTANRNVFAAYLYPGGIEEALKRTKWEVWSSLFAELARKGARLQYNRCMAAKNKNVVGMVEYLYKGRFFKLLAESTEDISYWNGEYSGILKIGKRSIEEIFGIRDRQKINRIREADGGKNMVTWMRWSDQTGTRISDETLQWLVKEKISLSDVAFIMDYLSPVKVMHYVQRQQQEVYKGKTARAILSTWEDYMRMCKREGKHVEDEIVYKPRDLKRRHREIVEEINKRQMLEMMKKDREQLLQLAEEMRKEYPGAEEVLKKVKTKYEYTSTDYKVIVPTRLLDIVTEGHALHHCVGSTERYFERIIDRETYICFLRRTDEEKVPFYTLEIEPGGTIRQHRGMFDEEPEIKKIRPFLREWQGVIKKRMTDEDRQLAKRSKKLREKNLEELREKKNVQVLKGLMEDFMEAV